MALRCPASSRFTPHRPPAAAACSQSQRLCFRKWVTKNRKWSVVCMQDATTTVPVPSTKEAPQVKFENGTLPILPSEKYQNVVAIDAATEPTVSITVVGASGDLAKKKIFPALFALYYEDCLPKHFTIFGYARSKMTDAELRNMVSRTLTCRIDKRENCNDKMDEFLKRCFYHSGQYDSEENFAELDKKLKEHEVGRLSNRLFYLSIPPNIFVDVAKCASKSASSANGWTRVIVEKPFGRDSESSAALTRGLKQYLVEDQIFRIDHYLGKELVENLSVLRFSNLVFEPLWTRQYIRNVQLIFSEDFGTEGRGGRSPISPPHISQPRPKPSPPPATTMWRRLTPHLRTLAAAASRRGPPAAPLRPISRFLSAGAGSDVVKKKVEEVMPIATGHEREEIEAELEGKKRFDMDAPCGPFGTKEAPAIVHSVYDKRIVGCPGGEGEDEHDVVWFWLEKGKPHVCPVCEQYFMLEVIGPGGPPGGHHHDDDEEDH